MQTTSLKLSMVIEINLYITGSLHIATILVKSKCTHFTFIESEREIKFIGLFGDRGHRGPYKQCNHNLSIGIIIFPHIDNPQSTGYNQPKKKTIKIINEKSEDPTNLTNHWKKRLWISLHVEYKKTSLNPNTETKPYVAIMSARRKKSNFNRGKTI